MSERRPSERPDKHPVFVYGGPSSITKGIKEVPPWYAKYQPSQQQHPPPPSENPTSPPPTPAGGTTNTTAYTLDDNAYQNRPRHASTGSIDMPNSPTSVSDAEGYGSKSRRSSSGSSSIFPSLRAEPNPAVSANTQGGGAGQRRDSMGRLFTGLTSQKRDDGQEGQGRRESWNEQRTVMGGGMERLVGGWWDGWLKGGKGKGGGEEGGK